METVWFDELHNPSTRYLLELLDRLAGIPFVYRDISTYEEFDFHLGRWVGRNTFKKDYALGNYSILYLGFHGGPGEISLRYDLADRRPRNDIDLDLDEIAESLLRDAEFDCRGAVIQWAGRCSSATGEAILADSAEKVVETLIPCFSSGRALISARPSPYWHLRCCVRSTP